MKGRVYIALGILLCATIFVLGSREGLDQKGTANLYSYQAEAFLDGRLHIEKPEGYVHDMAEYGGHHYSVFPPFPALLLTPFVKLFGVSGTHTAYIGWLLMLISICTLNRLLKRAGIDGPPQRFWIAAAFFLGTAYWYCVTNSFEVWFFAHVVAVTFLLLAIHEALGKGRGWVCGVFLAAAFLSRQMSIYTFFFLAALLWDKGEGKGWWPRLRPVITLGIALGFGVVAYCLFNWARFGHPLDTGYAYLSLQSFLKVRLEQHGVFSTAYLPFNLQRMFFQGFNVFYTGPDQLTPNLERMGTSLTFASPFLFFAFLARTKKLTLTAAWFSVALTLFHAMLYYNNGFAQINCQRFSLDFMPVLIFLTALGLQRGRLGLFAGLVVYAIAANVMALILLQP